MSVFQFESYRDGLREVLASRKKVLGKNFTYENLAKHCRVQRPYLSTVLNGNGHLSSDQVYLAAEFLGLTELEQRYLTTLLEYERSNCRARKESLKKDLERMRQQGLETKNFLTVNQQEQITDAMTQFYLDFNAQLIHMFLTVQRFAEKPSEIMGILQIDESVFKSALLKVEKAGLIRIEADRVEVLVDSVHLPRTSPLFTPYKLAMRHRSWDLGEKVDDDRKYNFSVLYSADAQTRSKILARFLEFVQWAQELTQKDQPTDVFQINFDFVQWSS